MWYIHVVVDGLAARHHVVVDNVVALHGEVGGECRLIDEWDEVQQVDLGQVGWLRCQDEWTKEYGSAVHRNSIESKVDTCLRDAGEVRRGRKAAVVSMSGREGAE